MFRTLLSFTMLLMVLLPQSEIRAGQKLPMPDFTRGEKPGESHDWNLGPTGARGWIYSTAGNSAPARQILVTDVAKGSPADGQLEKGDVILGIGDQPFASDARIALGRAITAAETAQQAGALKLLRWRNGQTQPVTLKLPVLGSYSSVAPFNCEKSKKIFEQGCAAIARGKLDNVSIPNNLNALALLASGREEYRPLLAAYAQKVAAYDTDNSWNAGYTALFLAEYALATKDPAMLESLKRHAKDIADNASAVGTWGHNASTPAGNCSGYGCMNSPGLVQMLALVTARDAGVKDPKVDEVIAKGAIFLRWYVNKGAIPYGDHAPWMGHDDNGKCANAAVLFDLLGDKEAATFNARMSVAAYDERERGHTGNFFNMLWALPGVSRSGPLATGAYWNEHSWYYDLARDWNGKFGYQGSPDGEEEHNKYTRWDCTGAYLLSYAVQMKSLNLTGKKAGVVTPFTAQETEETIKSGRDFFTSKKGYQGRTDEQLLANLSSWSPIVRRRAALGLAQSKTAADAIPALLKMLTGSQRDAQYGACEALAEMKALAAPAVPQLQQTLQHEDVWLRIQAAEALSAIGKPAAPALPDLLAQLAKAPTKDDPRGMEQRYLCYSLFSGGGMLARSLEGVDRKTLYAAIQQGLRNDDGRARGSLTSVYRNLKFEELKPLLPAIHEAVVKAAPSGEMFADEIRLQGLALLSKHKIEEGIQACVQYTRDQNPWGSQKRTPEIMKHLAAYGAKAKPVIPELQKLAETFEKGEKNFPKALSLEKAKSVRDTIKAIETSTANPELIRIAGLQQAQTSAK